MWNVKGCERAFHFSQVLLQKEKPRVAVDVGNGLQKRHILVCGDKFNQATFGAVSSIHPFMVAELNELPALEHLPPVGRLRDGDLVVAAVVENVGVARLANLRKRDDEAVQIEFMSEALRSVGARCPCGKSRAFEALLAHWHRYPRPPGGAGMGRGGGKSLVGGLEERRHSLAAMKQAFQHGADARNARCGIRAPFQPNTARREQTMYFTGDFKSFQNHFDELLCKSIALVSTGSWGARE